MSRKNLTRAGVRALIASLVLTAVFACGSAAGIYLQTRAIVSNDSHEDPHDHDAEDDPHLAEEEHDREEEGDHVALTKQAFENLELRLEQVPHGEYWKSLLVPATVAEIPGQSDLSVSAPVTGVVEEIRLLPGQSIPPDEPLFVIRLTDEALIDAQSKLLETLTRREIAEQEIIRLRPLTESGAVSKVKVRDLEYELKQLQALQSTLFQELQSRGLPQSVIKGLVNERELASTLTVFPPRFIGQDETPNAMASTGYSVEKLIAHPGKSVQRGEPLCTVAYHAKLYLEGTAFGDDLPILHRMAENDWPANVETHGVSHHHESSLKLELLRVDNHVDEDSQTVKFFVELPNEVTRSRRVDGRLFEEWRFRPGQRLHLRLPVEQWKDQLMLPVDAVVIDGPNVFVFAEHHHDEPEHALASTSMQPTSEAEDLANAGGDEHQDHEKHEDHEDVFMELEPIPVRLLYRDDKTVVIADDGQIHDGEPVAMNNAYKLYLAMKMQSDGGGGHHHHHDH